MRAASLGIGSVRSGCVVLCVWGGVFLFTCDHSELYVFCGGGS